eukprot:scaffold435088_cov50-Prasinocladus_malaysianus.AAC.1
MEEQLGCVVELSNGNLIAQFVPGANPMSQHNIFPTIHTYDYANLVRMIVFLFQKAVARPRAAFARTQRVSLEALPADSETINSSI